MAAWSATAQAARRTCRLHAHPGTGVTAGMGHALQRHRVCNLRAGVCHADRERGSEQEAGDAPLWSGCLVLPCACSLRVWPLRPTPGYI